MKQDPIDEGTLEFMLCSSCARQLLRSHDIEFVERPADRCANSWCGANISSDRHRVTITVQGADASQVQKVSLALIEKTKQPEKTLSPWVSGSFYLIVFVVVIVSLSVIGHLLPSFYLIVFVVVIVSLSVIGHLLPLVILPTVLVGGLVALSVIGALQMRQMDKLSEENFLKLMALSFKNLPWLVRRDTRTK